MFNKNMKLNSIRAKFRIEIKFKLQRNNRKNFSKIKKNIQKKLKYLNLNYKICRKRMNYRYNYFNKNLIYNIVIRWKKTIKQKN